MATTAQEVARPPAAPLDPEIYTLRARTTRTTDSRHSVAHLANRAYVQAIVDECGFTVEAIDAYADWLVNEWWVDAPRDRTVLRVAMTAFIDGWRTGYDCGHEEGHAEGEASARRTVRAEQR